MCGIVGYVGHGSANSILLDGLKRLEYRGYDSAGLALMNEKEIQVIKCKGRMEKLVEKTKTYETSHFHVGIGHTRWATHGEPSDCNSHPHISSDQMFCVVHNGIIENYVELSNHLKEKGYVFQSETDSEVIVHLLSFHYQGDIVQTLSEILHLLEGSYALGVVCKENPHIVYAARKDSPIVVGKGKNENFMASDIPALIHHTREVYVVEDEEIVQMDSQSIRFFNIMGDEVQKESFYVDWDITSAEKEGFPHFMLKEIHEEPKAIQKILGSRVKDHQITFDDLELERPDKIHIVACGTAFHAGIVGKYIIERLAKIPVEVDVASEFRYRELIMPPNTLTIIISQSGETIDTLFALRKAKQMNSKTLSIVNVVGSSIARESDHVIYTWAGPEIAVASTKAYSTQLSAIYLVALYLSDHHIIKEKHHHLFQIPKMIEDILKHKEQVQKMASLLFNSSSIFFMGRGLDYAISMEASLKLKEISYIHSEAYAGGELKHGTIALIEEGTPVVCVMTQSHLIDKSINNIKEVKARGAKVLVLTMEKYKDRLIDCADDVLTIPDIDEDLAPITAITPLQLFAYYCALLKGCDVDKPRNLAKSVTVE